MMKEQKVKEKMYAVYVCTCKLGEKGEGGEGKGGSHRYAGFGFRF